MSVKMAYLIERDASLPGPVTSLSCQGVIKSKHGDDKPLSYVLPRETFGKRALIVLSNDDVQCENKGQKNECLAAQKILREILIAWLRRLKPTFNEMKKYQLDQECDSFVATHGLENVCESQKVVQSIKEALGLNEENPHTFTLGNCETSVIVTSIMKTFKTETSALCPGAASDTEK